MNILLLKAVLLFIAIAAGLRILCRYIPFLKIDRLSRDDIRKLSKRNWYVGFWCLALCFLLAVPFSYVIYILFQYLHKARHTALSQTYEAVVQIDPVLWVFPSLIFGLHLGALFGHLIVRKFLGVDRFNEFMEFQNQASGFHVVRFCLIWGLALQVFCCALVATLYVSFFGFASDEIAIRKLGRVNIQSYSAAEIADLRCLSAGNATNSLRGYCEIQFTDKSIFRFIRPATNINYREQRQLLDDISVETKKRLHYYNFGRRRK